MTVSSESKVLSVKASLEERLTHHLSQLISFRTIVGANETKKLCLEYIEKTFLSSLSTRPRSPRLSSEENRGANGEAARPRSRRAAEIFRGDVAGCPYFYLKHPAPKLLWFAHIDVVPGKEEQFTLRKEGDTLLGRGVKDMKGAALPFFLAYKDACERGECPPVSILLTSDEETAGQTIPTLLKEGMLQVPTAFTPDTGSNPHIVVQHKGALWAKLEVLGKGTHGAMPWEGKNPIPLLADAIQRLAKAFPEGTEEDWHMTVTATELKGSEAKNQIPEVASCTLDIRFPPEIYKTAEEALTAIRRELPKGCSVTPFISTPPLKTDSAHPMVQLVKKIAEEVTGKEIPTGREHGATDARYFSAAGIPAFLYGPTGGGLHAPDEWVSLASLMQQYEFSVRLLQSLG